MKKSEHISNKKWKLCTYTENQLSYTEILSLLNTSAACQRISTFLFFLACTFCPRNLNSSGRHVWLRDRGRPATQTKPSPLFFSCIQHFHKDQLHEEGSCKPIGNTVMFSSNYHSSQLTQFLITQYHRETNSSLLKLYWKYIFMSFITSGVQNVIQQYSNRGNVGNKIGIVSCSVSPRCICFDMLLRTI